MRGVTRGLLAAVAWATVAMPAMAQTGDDTAPYSPRDEAQLLREASSHEWRGRLDEAETVLVNLLERNPTSSGGLFALERILRTRSRVAEVLPFVDRFLEASPGASGPRYMKLRVLVEVDSVAGLDRAAEAWFEAVPNDPDPYREVARVYGQLVGPERTLEVLREGRDRLGDDDALALETGDALAALGDAEGAAAEWARALRDPDADVDGVLRRLQRLEGDRETLSEPILAVLTRADASEARRRAAVQVAIGFDLPDLARRVASEGLRGLSAQATPGYLQDVARRAEESDMSELSLWALETLRRTVPAAAGDAAVEARMAAAALAAGDTTAATEAQLRLVRALPGGSVERRRAMADLIRVEVAASHVSASTLQTRLQGFRSEFPDAPELDGITAAVAAGVATRGEVEAALALVEPPPGPESRLERAWLLLDEGELEAGREALTASLSGLAPSAATEVIQLLAVLDRVGPRAGGAMVESGARRRHGDLTSAREALDGAMDEVPDDDRPALLFQAGRLAVAAGDTASARAYFARIEGAHFASAETPEAMLRHARLLAADPARADEARSLLERLILERPGAAVVPDARSELNRLGRGS
ncbi:hypothetical protein V3331_03500 [Gaopeijia maritima]|uniref:tetratricopeptide repeat protein n=1 Tax=Gaopeijia maritima TaxID=3119007 RepID=UPI003243BFD5